MRPRRLVTLVSVGLHVLVIATLGVAQLFGVGPLPLPHFPVAFADFSVVHLKDIELPAAPRARRESTRLTPTPNSAPIEAPPTIAVETGQESARTSSEVAPREEVGADYGLPGGLDGLGPGSRVAVPPPPAAAAPPPQAPIRLEYGMRAPLKISGAEPEYPALARTARIEGVVILEAVISATGRVESVRVLRSVSLLEQAAVDAVRKWRFTPTLLNGVPVPIVMTVTVNFTLTR